MLHDCLHCGASNHEHATACYVCLAPLSPRDNAPEAQEPSRPQSPLADETWRREIADRLAAYRSRRGDLDPAVPVRRRRHEPDLDQPALPFANPDGSPDSGHPHYRENLRTRGCPTVFDPFALSERVEIDASASDPASFHTEDSLPSEPLVPVASLYRRMLAGAIDAGFLAAASAAFYGLFRLFGGELTRTRFDLLIFASALFLLYAQYIALFTLFRGATPGMILAGVLPVSFDGESPGFGQLVGRTFGYLLSGATLGLGYLWCLWDEDSLTWHDRISQTYLTAVADLEPAPVVAEGYISDASATVCESSSPAAVLAAIPAAVSAARDAGAAVSVTAPDPKIPVISNEVTVPATEFASTVEEDHVSGAEGEPLVAETPALEEEPVASSELAPLTLSASASAPLPNPFRRAFPAIADEEDRRTVLAEQTANKTPEPDTAAPVPSSVGSSCAPLSSFDPDDTNEILANYDDPFLSANDSDSPGDGFSSDGRSPADSTSDLYTSTRARKHKR